MGFLSLVTGGWAKYGMIALGIALAAAVAWGGLQTYRLSLKETEIAKQGTLISELNTQKEALNASVTNLVKEIEVIKVTQTVLESINKECVANRTKHSEIDKEIQNAPASDDAPAAPVLRRTLERLRK
jgi:hypothetical protein